MNPPDAPARMINELLNHPDFAASVVGRQLREQPLGFIDVGARGGVHKIIEPLAGATAVMGFEPDVDEAARLQSLMASSPFAHYIVEPVALAADDGDAVLHLTSSAVNSSLRSPNPDFVKRFAMTGFDVVKKIPLRTTSLDKVFQTSPNAAVCRADFIKIDTQGTELEILQGATKTLEEKTVCLLVELEFFQMYLGEATFSEVEQWLRGRGFSFYGFDVHHRSAKLLDKRKSAGRERTFFADAIFFKDPLTAGLWKKPMPERSLHALFTTALLLEYYDFALQLALETWATGDEAARIRRLVESLAARRADRAAADVFAMAERIRANPQRANVEVGKFVDARRHITDFDDIRD